MLDFSQVIGMRIPHNNTPTEVDRIIDARGRVVWMNPALYKEPFYVEDVSGNDNTMSIVKNISGARTLIIEKSTDGVNWSTMGTTSTTAITAIIPANGRLYLRCSTESWGIAGNAYNHIDTTGNCNVGGNIMSLLYGDSFVGDEVILDYGYCFQWLFAENIHLVDASRLLLPATTLTNYCYQRMFYGCTSLTVAPALPASTLTYQCYGYMFSGCTSLTVAPALPATTSTQYCYISMFEGCTSLTVAPALPATVLANHCYYSMFRGCTSLTTAPELPATVLANYCYYMMFFECTILNQVKCLAEDKSADSCVFSWMYKVSPTGTFYKKSGITWQTGTNGIPEGWAVVEV